ncbi:MAG: LysR family transcriptional regulator [Vreelandella alkaliphila]|uniref:LysR family transcriptional regulator n=3 Tax=Halomonadaceae TaxID=28256 RepID=A0A060B0D0_9GAMM|nr:MULTISPECIES: LysR family transcriptional regulator [Halomonas]AIA73898.1 LysR family transcriptional regulator [Halomonas campaniensis]MCD6005507.1 LysR family transcriptional regulator [Halomonas sp. IOP_6]MCD6438505.1 LysR family transcriptional regulator [Halomonas sp.]PAU72267.1 LysR family transcriptional regulator [Halomonas humidisoli]UTA79372.1 LysR family transcriptional regulator [Halomonas sp. XH26]
MRRFDFFTLKLFISVADEGRLTAAAEREHLALAAVSKRMSDLESLVGATLLYRKPRGVELTPAGHAFLHHARRILDNVERLQAELSEYGEGVRGHVRIHSNTSAIIAFLPQDLSAFSRHYPEIKIDLQERVSNEIIAAVRDGLTDIGIFAGHVAAPDLQIIPYRRDRLVLVTPDKHPLAERSSIAFNEALAFDFIGLQQDASLQALLLEQANLSGRALRMRIQVRSFDAICRMIHHGMGVGVLPEQTIYRELGDLQLKSIPLSDAWAQRELVIGVRRYATLPVTARHMVDLLTAEKHSAL